MRVVWINLYQQGWYHREGKPGTLPFHAGDTYPDEASAVADIDPEAPYLGTVAVRLFPADFSTTEAWILADRSEPYPADSVPVPLRETRNQLNKEPQK